VANFDGTAISIVFTKRGYVPLIASGVHACGQFLTFARVGNKSRRDSLEVCNNC
jgi:hypothetical protein